MISRNSNEKKYGKERPFLSPRTFEYMLHQWTEWGQSVRLARKLSIMNYPLKDSYEERQKWINEQGGWAWQYAIKVMEELNLPEHLWAYWLCCVHSDYERADGSIDYSRITDFWGRRRLKIYPPPPYKVSVWKYTTEPGEFGPVTIEVHPSFSYKAVYDKAAAHAGKLAEAFGRGELHPILASRQWAKGQSQRSQHKLETRIRFQSGQRSLEEILKEEAFSLEVRQKVEEIMKKSTFERKNELIELRRRLLARIRAQLSDLGPLPRVKKGWWPYDMKKNKSEEDM